MKLAIVIPVYNEGNRLEQFLTRLITWLTTSCLESKYERADVIVIDDGSVCPISLRPFSGTRGDFPVALHLLRHELNLGQGAALQTGIAYAIQILSANTFLTMDADGQHRPEDIANLIRVLHDRDVDIVFGNRFDAARPKEIPSARRMLLRAAIGFEALITGLRLSDAHNGFRCFNAKCAHELVLKQNRMAHATEIKQLVARARLRYAEAPVRIAYSPESLRKGQKNIGSLAILKDLIKAYLFNG